MEKQSAHGSKQVEMGDMYSLFAQLVLDEALYQFRKKQLQTEIDRSLESGDKAAFFRLSAKLKDIS